MDYEDIRTYNSQIFYELEKEPIIMRDNFKYISNILVREYFNSHFSKIDIFGKYINFEMYYIPDDITSNYREYLISNISYKYKKTKKLFLLIYKNKTYELDHKIINKNPYPIIPQFIFDIQTNLIAIENQKKRDKTANTLSDNLNIISLSGELLLFGISNEVTIKDDVLFIHSFGKAYLRIKKDKSKFSLSISNSTETNSYIKIDSYTKDVLFEKIKLLAALNS